MNSRDPQHPRYRSRADWFRIASLRSAGRFIPVVEVQKDGKKVHAITGGTALQMRNKTHATTYQAEFLTALERPRRWMHNEWAKRPAGIRLVRIDPDGERIPRARTLNPGMTGKQTRRLLKKELRKLRDEAERS